MKTTSSKWKTTDKGFSEAQAPSFTGMSEQALWDEFRAGNRDALICIYNQYYRQLFKYAYRFTNDRAVVKDCIHDLFLTLQLSKEKLGGTTSIKYYMFRSLRRLLAEQARLSGLRGEGVAAAEHQFAVVASAEAALIQQEADQDQLARLEKAINSLPDRQREAVYYFYYENFSYQEMAGIMGFSSVKSARTLLYRALDTLRDILGEGHGPGNRLNGLTASLLFLLFSLPQPSAILNGVFQA